MYTYLYIYIYIYIYTHTYTHTYIYVCGNGPDSSVVRASGLGSGRLWVRSSPPLTEWVTGQTIQSLWRISSSTSGANTGQPRQELEGKTR